MAAGNYSTTPAVAARLWISGAAVNGGFPLDRELFGKSNEAPTAIGWLAADRRIGSSVSLLHRAYSLPSRACDEG
jgi:hypothetical protein